MHARTIRELLEDEVQDLYGAVQQILAVSPDFVRATSDETLRQALEEHARITEDQGGRLETVAPGMGVVLDGAKCPVLLGILKEAQTALTRAPQGPIRDSVILGFAQKVEHYEIAGYGAALGYARLLTEKNAAELFEHSLEETTNQNRILTGIAEHRLHQAAFVA